MRFASPDGLKGYDSPGLPCYVLEQSIVRRGDTAAILSITAEVLAEIDLNFLK